MASNESSMGVGLEYRSVLVKEIRMHSAYSRVAALTGLIGLGCWSVFHFQSRFAD